MVNECNFSDFSSWKPANVFTAEITEKALRTQRIFNISQRSPCLLCVLCGKKLKVTLMAELFPKLRIGNENKPPLH